MKVVVDTSILIDHLRGGTKWSDFRASTDRNTQLFLPTIVIFELFSGDSTKKSRELEYLVGLIKYFQRIELSEDVATRAGILCREFKKTLQVPDYIIAASALAINASVLTLNKKHFQKIPGIKVYNIENQATN